ncbi:DUF2877 domain-containing protein [Enterococcus wangshanyuanii]|uniref:DUF2877 domain-containing protein n=1 Tax=Enterococcus wangshanyuanii TaxID=2005703 RepID=A0ABQ1P344_9ENTE|nr:DUF2877 domain-containing protein [Enterococcus wangshanyuanii]GGC90050.1 hypothetical protein GCM10011573_19560 [Enterococcus wangshanyuanii]
MRTYKTLSGSQNFLLELQENRWAGEVHSTFDRTINIIDDSGTLYTIATAELDDAPNTIRVANFFKDRLQVPLNTRVFVQQGQLVIEGVAAIALDDAKKWQYPEIIFPSQETYQQITSRIRIVNRWLEQIESKGGYILNSAQATAYEKMMHTMLWKETGHLLNYLKEKQLFQAMKQVNRVVGLGPGLTPSGDDFLVGLALIFTTTDYPYHSLKQWLFNCRQELKKRTNEISFSTLDWAIKGAARERLGAFLNELFYGDDEGELKEKMFAVLAIGSTSGGDILSGMLAGIEFTLAEGREC